MKRLMIAGSVAIALAGIYSSSPSAAGVYESEIRVYQVITNISGNSSQTLPCSTGDIVHEIGEKLDSVALDMKGESLTWDGATEPAYPFIVLAAKLETKLPSDNPVGSIGTTSPAEYFEFKDGAWTLNTAKPEPGMKIDFHLVPEKDRAGVFVNNYTFDFSYIKERTPLPNAKTLDVGKPVIESIVSKGKWMFRLGEWSCLRLAVPSKGRMYVFVRTTLTGDTGAKPAKP